MPSERYGANPLHVHNGNRRSKQESEQSEDSQVHDKGFSKDREIGNILEHDLRLDCDSSLHIRVDCARIIIGASIVEPLAERLGCTKEIGRG